MDLVLNAEELAFQAEVRDFIATKLPQEIQDRVRLAPSYVPQDFTRTWQKLLNEKGWGAPNWPVEFGGTGWNAMQKYIYDAEYQAADCPRQSPFGISMVGPVICAFGTDAQKEQHLGPIIAGEKFWCQGYSEPGSGSDLASLSTRAVRSGDDYVVNGHKIWTSHAHHADWMFCLVRTDPDCKPQQGISFLLIDMKTPGITVRPIITLDEDHEVNEVFFDNVKVPVENLVGQENMGWTYAKYLLSHERNNVAEVGRSKRELRYLKKLAMTYTSDGKLVLEDPLFARQVAILEAELMALEITNLRVVSEDDGKSEPGPEVSMLKIVGTEVQQRLTQLMMQVVGPYGLPLDADFLEGGTDHAVTGKDDAAPLTAAYLNFRKASIYGGSNEIQKNIMNKMILGL